MKEGYPSIHGAKYKVDQILKWAKYKVAAILEAFGH